MVFWPMETCMGTSSMPSSAASEAGTSEPVSARMTMSLMLLPFYAG